MAMTVNEDGSTSSSIHQRQQEKKKPKGTLSQLQNKLEGWSKRFPARDKTTRMNKYKKQ